MTTAICDYLTTQETAQALNVTPRTVQRLTRSGKLPVRKRGPRGVQLIAATDIAAYMSTQSATEHELRDIIRALTQRVFVLEQRIQQIESLLDMTPAQRVTTFDADPAALRTALIALNMQRRWGVGEITSVLGDLPRLGTDMVDAVGRELVRTSLERVIVEARLLRHSRTELYVGRARLAMMQLNVELGVEEEHRGAG